MDENTVLRQFGYTNFMEVCETFSQQTSRLKLKTWRPYLKPNMNFLNLGCGGKILWPKVFKAYGANLIYIDNETDRYNSIHSFLKKENIKIDFTFREQDFNYEEELLFNDKEVDLCVADFMFSELGTDYIRDCLLTEIRRVSKKAIIMNLDYSNFENYESENLYEGQICSFMRRVNRDIRYQKTVEYFESRKEKFSLEIKYQDLPGREIEVMHAQLVSHLLSGYVQETELLAFLFNKNLVKKLPCERVQIVQF